MIMNKVREKQQNEDNAMIVLKGYEKRFGSVRIKQKIGPIDFEIPKNKCTLILGASGSGKSVILNSILGTYIRYRGKIFIDGVDRKAIDRTSVNDQIGSYSQMDFLSTDIALGKYLFQLASVFGIKAKEAKTRIEELMKFTDLYKERNKKVSSFSWGMKNRVNFIISVLKYPKLLLLDEPGANLDSGWRKKIINFLKEYKKNSTIVLVVHNISEAIDLADHIILLDQGRVIFNDSIEYFKLIYRSQVYFQSVLSDEVYANLVSELLNHEIKVYEYQKEENYLVLGMEDRFKKNINIFFEICEKYKIEIKDLINLPMDFDSITFSLGQSTINKEIDFYFKEFKKARTSNSVNLLRILKNKKLEIYDNSIFNNELEPTQEEIEELIKINELLMGLSYGNMNERQLFVELFESVKNCLFGSKKTRQFSINLDRALKMSFLTVHEYMIVSLALKVAKDAIVLNDDVKEILAKIEKHKYSNKIKFLNKKFLKNKFFVDLVAKLVW
ncbi:Vitamin B12 import ATP-binding protein BtuD [Mesoplasma sp. JKS002658]|uniref:ATP-binding cassette domain-containing protein n=1 Tax=Mesoplasma whartonense TaxID=2878854 RepID=UPI002022AEE4|nr:MULTISPECIES: ABC transporter ATP-binding protein [unclassified Mesoplasma]MCL8211136.1 Vitamin B12 import ATP-binding protein BtuD [Mesoplasma sp. JKS002664]MCL8211797.1 Vitamin B12 import ATP-binding protein BtuD [Mesoplasma sp. JKS002662]MCL8212657.1 Vitamin B12 import ATP-binding protein BtuD [Mesoplasma sp. JKS002661]MCL8213221.1 Vitamin B12 import ATP-binding protein BtuD [Mesoplasma sp. JKS002660]MCL8214098.1 Vitamin B12 import ATP-binding protein BtuD [Mesoplasma sp. JKS002658]